MEVNENKTTETITVQAQTVQPNIPPKTWLVESILVTIFCCLPFGIVGIVFASKVESLFYSGQTDAALKASQDAGKWTKIGFWVGLGWVLLSFIFYGVYFLILGATAGLDGLDF